MFPLADVDAGFVGAMNKITFRIDVSPAFTGMWIVTSYACVGSKTWFVKLPMLLVPNAGVLWSTNNNVKLYALVLKKPRLFTAATPTVMFAVDNPACQKLPITACVNDMLYTV
jgi:hypothetical protein